MMDIEKTTQEHEQSFGAVVFQKGADKKHVLLVKTDHWGFPKGHPEHGENAISAALREVKEETGVAVEIVDAEKSYTEEYEIQHGQLITKKRVTYFVGLGEGVLVAQEGEIREARWVPVEAAAQLLTFQSSRTILQSLL